MPMIKTKRSPSGFSGAVLSINEYSNSTYHWSNHALARWQERFPGINRDLEFSSAKRMGKKTKKRIKVLTPVNAERYMIGGFKGRYYLLGRSNVVFVIDSKESVIVTVFHLYGD